MISIRHLSSILSTGLVLAGLSAGLVRAEDFSAIEEAARGEGQTVSVGMPDDWANWGALWKALEAKYGFTHSDTDLSSSEMVAKFEAEKNNPTVDLAEPSLEFSRIAAAKNLLMPFKPRDWDKVPDWAKDPDGHWTLAYTGSIAFLVRKDVANPPKSFSDLVNGTYKVSVGEVGKSAQANAAVLAAAVAMGGSESDLKPGIDLFAGLADQKRVIAVNPSPALMEKGEVEVAIVWDFTALGWRDKVGADKWDVWIPADGSVTSGYCVLINAQAPHPNIAKLVADFALTDEGQALFAAGGVRPIRIDQITLAPEVMAKLLPSEQYAKARGIDFSVWGDKVKDLTRQWQEEVASRM